MRRVLAALTVGMLALAGCGNSDGEAESTTTAAESDSTVGGGEAVPVVAPGVTDTEIRVGGVASVTNPLGGSYGNAFEGVKAYFEMVNSEGGVHGRKLVLAQERDDKVSGNKAEIEALISAEGDQAVFAILPVASLLFTGADSAVAAGIPTFGWTINPEWEGTADNPKANLFGQTGSFLGFDLPGQGTPWLANELGAEQIGVLAYSVPQSALCADGVSNSFETYADGTDAEVVFEDKALSYGETNLSVQVSKMKDEGVDLVLTCMDTNGVVTLAREMKKQALDAKLYLPNGYDDSLVEEFGDLFEGSYVRTDFAGWHLPEDEQPDGLKNFLEWTEKAGVAPSENAIAGWLNADLFVEGLKAAGPNFDRQKLIDAINAMTDYKADGIIHNVDWTRQHTQRDDPDKGCDFKSIVEDSELVPAFTEPGKPFHCVDGSDPANLEPVNEP